MHLEKKNNKIYLLIYKFLKGNDTTLLNFKIFKLIISKFDTKQGIEADSVLKNFE